MLFLILVECMNILDISLLSKIAEKYLNNNKFTHRTFYPFSSPGEALVRMKAICNSIMTKHLKSFLMDNIPQPSTIISYRVTSRLGHNIRKATGISVITGQIFDQVMRDLRVKIDKFIVGLEPRDLVWLN